MNVDVQYWIIVSCYQHAIRFNLNILLEALQIFIDGIVLSRFYFSVAPHCFQVYCFCFQSYCNLPLLTQDQWPLSKFDVILRTKTELTERKSIQHVLYLAPFPFLCFYNIMFFSILFFHLSQYLTMMNVIIIALCIINTSLHAQDSSFDSISENNKCVSQICNSNFQMFFGHGTDSVQLIVGYHKPLTTKRQFTMQIRVLLLLCCLHSIFSLFFSCNTF